MERPWEKLENYQKNLRCLQEAEDELLGRMKGHDWSFRRSITDGKGKFSQEKLQALVKEMMETWAAAVREHTDADPDTGESLAEPWLQERRELCGLYLYLVMRCTLEKGGYSDARNGGELKERADFAFLLEQARRFSRDWCVLAGPDGSRRSEPYRGFDSHFGFHLYYALNDPGVLRGDICRGNDYALTPDWRQACSQSLGQLTNEGSLKRLHIRHSGFRFRKRPETEEPEIEKSEELEPETEETELEEPEPADQDEAAPEDAVFPDPEEDDEDWYFPFPSEEAYREFQMADMDRLSEEGGRAMGLTFLAADFEGREEYCSACERFAALFQAAGPGVLRDFYQDLEAIVDLYLAVKEIAPLTNTDKALDVYNRLFDGALRQAKRYGRSLRWEAL